MMDSTTWTKIKSPLWTKCWVIGLWLLLWQGAYLAVGQDLLLVGPVAVAQRLLELAVEPGFWQTIWYSLRRIFTGFLLGVGAGTLLGVFTARSRLFYEFVRLPMGVIKATPVASFVILALVWISGKNLSIFISFLMVLPLVWQNVHEGIRQTDPQLLEMAQVFRLPARVTLRVIYLPQVMPYFLTAVRVAMGFAWKSGIAGEVLAIPAGSVGSKLYFAKVYLDTPDLFAWTVVILLLSLLIERGLVSLLDRGVRRLTRLTGEGGTR